MWKMLKHIGQTHRRKLITTFSLVGLDNLLLLVYPVFGGWAINAVMEGNVWQAMLYGVVVLLMWIIGAARRAADTRTFYPNLYRNRRPGRFGTAQTRSTAFRHYRTRCPIA